MLREGTKSPSDVVRIKIQQKKKVLTAFTFCSWVGTISFPKKSRQTLWQKGLRWDGSACAQLHAVTLALSFGFPSRNQNVPVYVFTE